MSFGRFCDGYIVLHAPHLSPERLPLVKKELARVGVDNYIIQVPETVSKEELEQSKYSSLPTLSIIKSIISCIEHARRAGWKRFAYFEDDVIFRPNFQSLWTQLEPSISNDDWGMLTLFRWPTVAGEAVVREKYFEKTTAVVLRHNICSHAILFQSNFYLHAITALHQCIANGWPADFMYGIITEQFTEKVIGTTKNLAGQRGGLVSTIQSGYNKGHNHYATYRSSYSALDYHLINTLMPLLRRIKRLK